MLALAVAVLLSTQAPAPVAGKDTPTPPPSAPAPALATSANPPARPRILVLETRADAAYLEQVRAFGDLLATLLESRTDAEVIPSSSVKDRLSVAADRLSAGCDDTACMTEIAGALDARYVIASRASQVGGRWLMRVELFDSQDLKVIAQATAMAEGVEGLAAQAEALADDVLARAPVIGRHASTPGAVSGGGTGTLPPPDANKGGGNGWLLGGGIAALAGSAVLAGVGAVSYFLASGDERKTDDALAAYRRNPNVDTRDELINAARVSDNSSSWHNCLFVPIGCACIPVGLGGAGALGWAMLAGDGAESEE